MEIGKTFCGRTDVRTDGRTHLSSNLLGHRRGDDLKISPMRDWQSTPLKWLFSSTRDLDLDLGSGHTASTSVYTPNFTEIAKTFSGQTNRRDPSKFKVTWHEN